MNDDAAPYVHVVVNGDVGMEYGAVAQRDALADHAARANAHGHARACSIAHHRVRPNISERAQFDIGPHHRRGMDAGLDFRRGIEAAHRTRERGARFRHADHRAVRRALPIERHQQTPGCRAFGLRRGFPPADKRQFRRAGRFDCPRARQFLFAVAFKSGAQPLGQFTNSHGPIMTNPSSAGAAC